MAHSLKGNEDREDVSVLRTPIQLHGKTVEQILNGVHYGTPELRSLLLDECDIIFECKVCRALFRDLPNLISHKRRYCSKSATEDDYLALSRIPDEKVYVVQPQEPTSSNASVGLTGKSRPKPSLDDTIARIQSGELGHSHAFNVYSDAARKLQRQKEDMKVATIRTRAIPTNPNAVFVDVNMTSVNIHERQAAATGNSSPFNSVPRCSLNKRKAKERMNANKSKNLSKRVRILRKDCKNSGELQKMLTKELREIQFRAKLKAQGSDLIKQTPSKRQPPKIKSISSEKEMAPSIKTVLAAEKDGHSSDTGLIAMDRQSSRATSTKIESMLTLDNHTPSLDPGLFTNGTQVSKATSSKVESASKSDKTPSPNVSNGVSRAKRKRNNPAKITQEGSRVCKMPSPSPNSKYKLSKKSLICQKCHGMFSSKQSLAFHTQVIHSSKKTFYPCLFCPSVFYYFVGVTRHLKINHSMSKAEIKLLTEKLRAKAYTKVVKEEADVKPRLTGLRKSARHKQEAFSNETSPDSSYILHSLKKMGKKLSAKKDSMSTHQAKEKAKESNKSEKFTCVTSSSINNSRNILVKKEPESPSNKYKLNILASKRKHKTHEKKFGTSPASPKSFPTRHSCKKCRRKFGRLLTYKNHIKVCQGKIMPLSSTKVCQGKIMPLSSTRRPGRPRKYPLQDTCHSSAVSTRSRKVEKVKSSPFLKAKVNDAGKLEEKALSNHTTCSTSKESNKSETLDKQETALNEISDSCNKGKNSQRRQKDSESESSNTSGKNASAELDTAKVYCDSVSISTATSDEIVGVKSDVFESKSLEKPAVDNTEPKTKEKSSTSSLYDNPLPTILKSEKMSNLLDTSGCQANVDSRGKQKVFNQKVDVLSSSQTHDGNKMNDECAGVASGKDGDTIHITRSSTSIKGLDSSVSDFSPPKTRSALSDTNKERRSLSGEKEFRSRISHLIPRASGDTSVVKRGISRSSLPSLPSTSQLEERPRRKRKVPTRNIDAMEMLSKIHNPEKDDPLSKNLEMNTTRPSRGRPPLNTKQASIVKSHTRGIKRENGPHNIDSHSRYQETKEVRLRKNRSRIFVLGRNQPRGRKLLRSYDNARVDKLIDIQNSKCLVCGEYCSKLYNLRRHIIRIHLQWSRYQCSLCRFTCFDRSECRSHILRNHRRMVNIESAQAVNSCICDLAKQGSKAMNLKKNQTIRDKSRQQTNETNIYARPNMRKMPRLSERTLIHEEDETYSSSLPSPQGKQKLNNSREDNIKGVRQRSRAEVVNPVLSENSLKRSSTPFNISTRNSPQMFDAQTCKISATSNAKCQDEVGMLHTRKCIHIKTISSVPSRNKCDSETPAKVSIPIEMRGKVASKLESLSDNYLSKDRNIFCQMGLPSSKLSSSDESLSSEMSLQKNESVAEETDKEESVESSSHQCDKSNKVISDNNKVMADGETSAANPIFPSNLLASDEKLMSNGPSSPPASSFELKSLRSPKVVNKDPLLKLGDPHHSGLTPSSSINASLSVSDPLDSSNTIRISPSYVVIKSARIPPSVCVSSSSVAKTLNFSQTSSNEAENCSGHSHSNASDHIKETLPKTTLFDSNIDDDKSSSPVSALSGKGPEETQVTINDVQHV